MTDKHNSPQTRTSLDRRSILRAVVASTAAIGALGRAPEAHAQVWEEGEEQCRAQVKERPLGANIDDAMLEGFMEVSRGLTGVDLKSEADRRLGRQYLERFARVDELADFLPKLIEAYRNAANQPNTDPAQAVMSNKDVRAAAEQLIYLWYLSAFYLPLLDPSKDPAKRLWVYGTTEQYDRALLWNVVHAHAPMSQPTGMLLHGKPPPWVPPPRVTRSAS
jgi:Membrane bound FAD containing D-sorbitol dehydrogenase